MNGFDFFLQQAEKIETPSGPMERGQQVVAKPLVLRKAVKQTRAAHPKETEQDEEVA